MTTVSPTPTPTPSPVHAALPHPVTPPQPAMQLRELVFGAARAAAVRAAARLGVADALGETPATAQELAALVKAEAGAAAAAAARPVLLRDLHRDPGRAVRPHGDVAPAAQGRPQQPARHLAVVHRALDLGRLAAPRRRGAHRQGVFADVHGKGFFDYLHQEAHESAQIFNRAMTTSSMQSALDVAELLDLTGVSTVADIGGGQGHVLASLLEKDPSLHGTLMDLPGVVARADARLRDEGALVDRTRIVAGDCRETIPVDADLYIIKNILEWDDESTRRTLRNVIAAARPGARVVIIENLVDDTPSMRFTTAMDLLLLLNVGGAKHTRESLVTRISDAGLLIGDVVAVNPYLDAFECVVPG